MSARLRVTVTELIIIDRTETPLDDVADLVLRGEIGRILPALAGMAGRTDATRG